MPYEFSSRCLTNFSLWAVTTIFNNFLNLDLLFLTVKDSSTARLTPENTQFFRTEADNRPRKGHRQQIISLITGIIKFLFACNFNVNLKDWRIYQNTSKDKGHYLIEEEYLIQDNCTVAALWQFLFSGKIAFLSWYCRTPSANIVHLHFNFLRNAFPKPNTRVSFLTTGMKGLNVRRHKWYWCLIYINYSKFSRRVEQHCTLGYGGMTQAEEQILGYIFTVWCNIEARTSWFTCVEDKFCPSVSSLAENEDTYYTSPKIKL